MWPSRTTCRFLFSRERGGRKSTMSTVVGVADSFAFSGCGWLTPYHLGVIRSLREGGYLTTDSVVSGSSGGSIAATLAATGIDTSEAMEIISKLSINEQFKKEKDLGIRNVILSILPDRLSYLHCSGKLHITVTQVAPTLRALLISEFESNEDLAEAVCASCFIPLWSNSKLSTAFRGTRAIDGGVYAFMPPVGNVTVTPFPGVYSFLSRCRGSQKSGGEVVAAASSGGGPRSIASISPLLLPPHQRLHSEARLAYWGLDPPPPAVLRDLFELGARSADAWMDSRRGSSP